MAACKRSRIDPGAASKADCKLSNPMMLNEPRPHRQHNRSARPSSLRTPKFLTI